MIGLFEGGGVGLGLGWGWGWGMDFFFFFFFFFHSSSFRPVFCEISALVISGKGRTSCGIIARCKLQVFPLFSFLFLSPSLILSISIFR